MTNAEGLIEILLQLLHLLQRGLAHESIGECLDFAGSLLEQFPSIRSNDSTKPSANRQSRFLHVARAQQNQRDDDDKGKFRGAYAEYFHTLGVRLSSGQGLTELLLNVMLMLGQAAQDAIDEPRGTV